MFLKGEWRCPPRVRTFSTAAIAIFQRGPSEKTVFDESKGKPEGKPWLSGTTPGFGPRPDSAVWRPPKMSEPSQVQVDTSLPFPTPRSARPGQTRKRDQNVTSQKSLYDDKEQPFSETTLMVCFGICKRTLSPTRWALPVRTTQRPQSTQKQRFKNQNLRLQKTRIPTAGSVFLKCPFNGKAGLLFFNARHDDSGPRRSIFAEKPRKTASVKGIANSKGAERHRY